MSIPFENLSFNETVLIQQFLGERTLAVFFVLYFSTASNRVSGGNASISSTFTKSGSL
jgi:hypothetical protein